MLAGGSSSTSVSSWRTVLLASAKLAQDFAHRAHNFGQAFGADDNQRDREDQGYFKKIGKLR